MDISTKEGRAELLVRLLATAPAAFSHDMHTTFRAALRLLDERDLALETQQAVAEYLSNEIMHLKAEHARIIRERDAEIERLRKRLRAVDRETRDAARDAAAQARHEGRYPDEPYGTY